MTLSFTATGATKYVPGPYRARMVEIEQKAKTVEKKVSSKEGGKKATTETEERPYLRWIFEILEKGFEGQSLSVLSSTSFGVGPTGPAKGRRIAEALFGRELEIGEKFTADDLYGKELIVHVDNEKTNRGTFARIVDFTPIDGPPF